MFWNTKNYLSKLYLKVKNQPLSNIYYKLKMYC